jgi:hypothetical protein
MISEREMWGTANCIGNKGCVVGVKDRLGKGRKFKTFSLEYQIRYEEWDVFSWHMSEK